MNYIVAATTDIGLTKNTNQDSYQVRVFSTACGKMVFAVLCDGMGGLSKGEIASASLVKAFFDWSDNRLPELSRRGLTDGDIRMDWTKITDEYNEKIKNYGKLHGIQLGTTITAILLTESRYYVLNIGDSRTYEITDSVTVLTKDQTVVAREIENGRLTQEEAERDPRRSILLQCVGASDMVCPDFFFGEPKKNAVYMLCSDGFRHEITPEEIYQYFQPGILVNEEVMKENMGTLIALNKQRKERDNITVVLIRTY